MVQIIYKTLKLIRIQKKRLFQTSSVVTSFNLTKILWSMVKSHNNTFQINDVKILFERKIESVTAEDSSDLVRQ